MKSRSMAANGTIFLLAAFCVLSLVGIGCRPNFPQCRSDDDCKAEEGNSTLLVCVNGQCQECGKDADCPKDRAHCKDSRCVECVQDSDCPEDKPFCKEGKCGFECEVDADCDAAGKVGMVCEKHKCKWQCETDADCPAGNECKEHRCVPKCQCQSDQDCPEGKSCVDCACVGCRLETIHFDFNKYAIRGEDQSLLEKNAKCLVGRPDTKVTIEGNCDDRGTEEYNVALGDKRARAAKKALEAQGVKAGRIKTISYGESRPACTEQTEDCWAKNRRADFVEQ